MSAAPGIARVVSSPASAARSAATPRPADAPAPPRRLAARIRNEWLPRLVWTVDRTGRPGLVGIALLLAAGVFLVSTHLKIAAEVASLRAGQGAAPSRAHPPAAPAPPHPVAGLSRLPAGTDVPAMLRQLFSTATQAKLAVDTGRYEVNTTKGSSVVRYEVSFPVTGPYPQIRSFIDSTLTKMPVVALSGLLVERKAISEGEVEAQIRMTIYTAAPGATGAPGARPAPDRVAGRKHAAALFAQHSWTVIKPVVIPPPTPPPPPPDPTAPPFPYAYVGSYTSAGGQPTYFLSKGDRMVQAHVGDQLDGVYRFESAAGGQLVFVYLPLNIRQNIPAGVSQ
jgi:hypothetical protein